MSDHQHLKGYRGRWVPPRKGSPLRRAFDAMHALYCGPDCPPDCREWQPDVDAIELAVVAYGGGGA